jgi:DNA primase
MIGSSTVEQIKQAAHIEEVVGEFVRLKRRGANMIGLCPFHKEKTPSFSVNPGRNIYKCFGCGRGGDSIDFLKEHEQLSYPEALRWLAQYYNITIEEAEESPEQKAERDHNESLYIINRFSAEWFANQLFEEGEGRSVGLSYFRERGFHEAIIKEFALGWCPSDGAALTRAAKEAGYQQEFLEELGLTRVRNGRAYDFYRERIMFPIHNLSGKVIAFGARTLKTGPKIPKYINSPESAIYVKNQTLYGLHQSKRFIREEQKAILVEGYTDVLALHQGGIKNVVASSGTSLTENQVTLLKRFTPEITILYDSDQAGINAALRGTEMILEQGLQVRIVLLPQGEDPDSMLRSAGSEAFKTYLEREAKDFVLFKAGLLMESSAGDPIKRAALVRDIVGTISKVSDPVARALYTKQTARLMELDEQLLIRELNKLSRSNYKKTQQQKLEQQSQPVPEEEYIELRTTERQQDTQRLLQAEEFRDLDFVRLLLQNVEEKIEDQPVYQFILGDKDPLPIENPLYLKVISVFQNALDKNIELKESDFLTHDDPEIKKFCIGILEPENQISENWKLKHGIHITDRRELIKSDIEKTIGLFRYLKSNAVRKQLMQELELAEKSGDNKKSLQLLNKLKQLNDWRKSQLEAINQIQINRLDKKSGGQA